MYMAFLQHGPENMAFGFGDRPVRAAQALLEAYPCASKREFIEVIEVRYGQGISDLSVYTDPCEKEYDDSKIMRFTCSGTGEVTLCDRNTANLPKF